MGSFYILGMLNLSDQYEVAMGNMRETWLVEQILDLFSVIR